MVQLIECRWVAHNCTNVYSTYDLTFSLGHRSPKPLSNSGHASWSPRRAMVHRRGMEALNGGDWTVSALVQLQLQLPDPRFCATSCIVTVRATSTRDYIDSYMYI